MLNKVVPRMADEADPDNVLVVKWDLLVSDAWSDAELKKRLLSDARAVLVERGIDLPADVDIQIYEDTDTTTHLVIPTPPSEGELSEEQLEAVAGGGHSHHSVHSRVSGHHSGGHGGGHGGHH